MKIIWTVKTERQLVQIFEYIASDSELYAYRLVNQLEFKCHKLKGSKTYCSNKRNDRMQLEIITPK